ncbi:ATP-dependent RNA helicase dhx29-like [Mytilus edulis]|uniref:ATP-dependent RNA helicase dhx29-like n=1 Tax=Mytilus edulis TaxID=6550 RepID=UPI0039F0FAAE
MGKKRQQQKNTETEKSAPHKIDKSKKTYSLPTAKVDDHDQDLKIRIPQDLEKEIVDVIQDDYKELKITKDLSNRLTTKKLTDMYTSLAEAGFSHSQIEQTMTNTVLHGGDLIDALDWLCLNLANNQLPQGFSDTLEKEEVKNTHRPKFDDQLTEQKKMLPSTTAKKITAEKSNTDEKPHGKSSKSSTMKDWILQYTENSSDESQSEEEYDPNEKYLELTAKLLDAREEAVQAKLEGAKSRQKEISNNIRKLVQEMNSIEEDSRFNPAVKIKDLEKEKINESGDQGQASTVIQSHDTPCDQGLAASLSQSHDKPSLPCQQDESPDEQEESEDFGDAFTMFENQAAEEKPKEPKIDLSQLDIRQFEYTRQQWTGKSPKQFLIDWCRKHKVDSPKYHKMNPVRNLWKCRVTIGRKKEETIEACPEILCENVKEAEHLGCTLALYQLCKGQAIHQLLPPPYRDVWLEWQDSEKAKAKEAQTTENKPRDQLITKLMKKLQLGSKNSENKTTEGTKDDDDTVDSWENLDEEIETEKLHTASMPGSKKHRSTMDSTALLDLCKKRQQTDRYRSLHQTRQNLPVYQYRESIVDQIRHSGVTVIAGETGSGKSTQIPQFLLERYITEGNGAHCNIVCTEPRRISAISLAQRVSEEMAESGLGQRDSLVGYQIRFESKCGPNTRLNYCTTGVLLRKLQSDTILSNVTHVIVDEVHERSVQSDFLLVILKRLMLKRPDLKVILMSATLDSEKFSGYFQHCPVINIPGRTFPVQVYYMEDVVNKTGYAVEEDSPYSLRSDQLVKEEQVSLLVTEKGGDQSKVDVFWTKDSISKLDLTTLSPEKYSLKTRNTITRMNQNRINFDLIVETLLYISNSEEFSTVDGAVLIFLPGLADIQEVYELLQSDRKFSDTKRYQILALHSVLSSSDQSLAFKVPPPGVRKIVIATNIAETGITIPDVVFVIDTGKVKETRYIESSQMSSLKEVFISKANGKQRQGRAGRVREGFCFRLYTHQKYKDLADYTVPEIQRVPLEELCLHIMKCQLGEPDNFLAECLDPPRPQVIARAMSLLYEIGACKGVASLTPLGHHLAALPVHVRIGKMLLFGAIFGYVEPVAVIAAAMTTKSPFVAPLDKLDLANLAKNSMATSCSDHLTLYRAYTGWKQAQKIGYQSEQQYCQKNFLKRHTLLEIENVKNDLIKLVRSIGFSDTIQTIQQPKPKYGEVLDISKAAVAMETDLTKPMIAMVKAVITAGLYPSVAKVTYDAPVDAAANPRKVPCLGETAQGPAHVHPSSVNRHLAATGWIAYQEKVTTSKVYLRETTLVSPFSLLLFGGDIHVQHTAQLVTVDDRIKFRTYAKTGVIFRELRKLLDELLDKKLENPTLNLLGDRVIKLICRLIDCEK